VGFTKKDLDDLTKTEREYICARCRILPDDFDVLHEKKKLKTKHVSIATGGGGGGTTERLTLATASFATTVTTVAPLSLPAKESVTHVNVLSLSASLWGVAAVTYSNFYPLIVDTTSDSMPPTLQRLESNSVASPLSPQFQALSSHDDADSVSVQTFDMAPEEPILDVTSTDAVGQAMEVEGEGISATNATGTI
jgi:hypothetical protein